MDDLLTTRQVQDFLKVERITIYRMLNDGRLKGVKIGQQWRFPRQEVERILGTELPQPVAEPPAAAQAGEPTFPTHCIQTIQDLFSELSQISAFMVDLEGRPLTEISRPCRCCQIMLQNSSGQPACQASWKEFASQSRLGSRYFTCHAGLQYISSPILDEGKLIGYFLAGEFYWRAPDGQEEGSRIQNLAEKYNLPFETFKQASTSVPVIPLEQHSRVETWPVTAARAIQSILHERSGFIERLQQIANLTHMQ